MNFTSDISLLWLLPWAVFCGFAAYYLYRKEKWLGELKRFWHWIFKGLRFGSLFLLGLLLVGLLFEAVEYRVEKPILVAIVDDSASMKNYKDSTQIQNRIQTILSDLNSKLGEFYDIKTMLVGEKAVYGQDFTFKSDLSNLAGGFQKIQTDFYNRNVGGLIFISDGNYNTSTNPTYFVNKLNFTPIFSVGVGDTLQKKDQLIKNIVTNEVAFLNNLFPVEVSVEAFKMGKSPGQVEIYRDGKLIQSQAIQYKDGLQDFVTVNFQLKADYVGYHAYTVKVKDVANEFNYKNNQRTFYIEVIDSRNRILILAGAPHPDVAALAEALQADENNEVRTELSKTWDKNLSKTDLIIWHEPGINFDPAIESTLESSGKPIFYILGPNTNSSTVNRLNVGLRTGASSQLDDVQVTLKDGFQQFEISDQLKTDLTYFPPLKVRFGEASVSAGADVLLNQRIGSISKKDVVLYFNKRKNNKYGVLYGEGVWRWRLNNFQRTSSFASFNELFQKSIQFLSVKGDQSSLRVNLAKRFTKNEEIIVNASFYNEALQPITSPKIDFNIKDEQGKRVNFVLGIRGSGYQLSLGKLNPGKYEWTCSTSFNGKKHTKSGVIIVEDVSLENLNTVSNSGLMLQLAKSSGGAYFRVEKTAGLADTIKNRPDITSISYREAAFNNLIDYKMLFFLLLLFIAVEWFLRRWFGVY